MSIAFWSWTTVGTPYLHHRGRRALDPVNLLSMTAGLLLLPWLKPPTLVMFLAQACGRLSRGQQAQVSLALAMAPDPELLILDDPTLGLSAGLPGHLQSHRHGR